MRAMRLIWLTLGFPFWFPFWILNKLFYLSYLLFAGDKGRKVLARIGWQNWLKCFLAQRVLNINSHVPWPCHWSSVVSGIRNIHLTTFPPFPGLGPGQYIQGANGIHFGANIRLGPGVKIISANHDTLDFERHLSAEPIMLGDNCWVGADAIILPGVRLGNHVVVAAGSVVTKSFETDNIVLGGVPAKVLRQLGPYEGGTPSNAVYLKDIK